MAEIKGKITVEISDDYLSAILLYTPDEKGPSWNPKQINDLLDDEMVTFGVDDQALEKTIKQFSEQSRFKSDPIAKGQGADPAKGEFFQINKLEMPDHYRLLMDKSIGQAAPPEIFELRQEKVKSGAFKKEETQERRVPVKVNKSVIDKGYYHKDEIAGNIFAPSSGKPGKTVTGHAISPGKPVLSRFNLGSNLTKSKNGEVKALCSGFLRVGENWADLIPFNDHHLELSLSKDKANCIMTVIPAMKELPQPEISLLYRQLDELKYSPDKIIPEKQIKHYIGKIIQSGKKGNLSISRDQDAQIEIKVNSNETEAELYLKKGRGKGITLNLNSISNLLNKKGLKGVKIPELKKEITAFYHSHDEEISLPLCKGRQPERGKDGSVNFNVEFQEEEFLQELKSYLQEKPELLASCPSIKDFSMDRVGLVALVKKDSPLFSLGNAGKGKDGLDVFGKAIPGMKGNDPEVRLFEGINYKGGTAKAEKDGILEVLHDEMENSLFARIRDHKDAEINVTISENEMRATINVNLPSGTGLYASEDRIKKVLDDSEVYEGIIEEQIKEAAETSKKGEVLMDFLVAEGKFPMDKEKELRLFHDIDHQKNNSAPIKQGEKIGEILIQGKDRSSGFTVRGEKLEGSSKDSIEIGDNIQTQVSEQDGKTILVAENSGQLFFNGTRIFIKDTLKIEGDLTSTMGKAFFPGNIHITGSVQTLSVVKSGENIQVDEVVESALLSAGGNIRVLKGIKGNKKAALRAQENIYLGYAEETNLMAVASIQGEKALLHCHVKCNGKLILKPGSKIIGGNIKVKSGLETDTIGSERGASTHISFGQDYLVQDQINQTDREIQKVQDQILKIEGIIQTIQEKGGKNSVLLQAREKKRKALKMIEKKNLKNFLLREKFEMHFDSSITIRNTVYPGTVFESHGRTLEIEKVLKSIKVFFDQSTGKISHKPL